MHTCMHNRLQDRNEGKNLNLWDTLGNNASFIIRYS